MRLGAPLRQPAPTRQRLLVFVPALEALGVLMANPRPAARQVWVEYRLHGAAHKDHFAWEDLQLVPARCGPHGHYWVDARGRGRMFLGDEEPPGNPESCLLCGMSMWRHAFTECP